MGQWKRQITGFGEIVDTLSAGADLIEVRDRLVALLRDDPAYDRMRGDLDFDFTDAVDNLSVAEDEREFEQAIDDLYDWADKAHVWISPDPQRS